MGKEGRGTDIGVRRREAAQPGSVVAGVFMLVVGACLLVPEIAAHGVNGLNSGGAIGGVMCVAFGLISFVRSRTLPTVAVMRLAEARNGLLSLSEIVTSLNIHPAVAERTLRELSQSGIARQRWLEFNKNLWEFPDYMKLPINEAIDVGRQNGGRVSASDLMARGQTMETARQTLDALEESGAARPDPDAAGQGVMLERR